MLGTSTTYLLLQGPGIYYGGLSVSEVAWKESSWALIGMILCFVLFVGYLWYQIRASSFEELGGQQDRRNSVIEEALRKGEVTLLGVMQSEFGRAELRQHLTESTPLVLERNPQLHNRLKVQQNPLSMILSRRFSNPFSPNMTQTVMVILLLLSLRMFSGNLF